MAIGNTRVKVQVGLQNTYNVFSLSEGVNDILRIEIIKDADKKIENIQEVPDELHYNSGAYPTAVGTDHNYIAPICQTSTEEGSEFTLSKYGPILYKKIMEEALDQTDVDVSSITNDELWGNSTSYENYVNQFKIMWPDELKDRQQPIPTDNQETEEEEEEDDNPGDQGEECWDTIYQYGDNMANREYVSYTGDIKKFGHRRYYSGTYNEMKYFYLNVDIIHFSKYYPVYDKTDLDQKILTPIIYNDIDLENYNLALGTEDDGETHVHVNTFLGFNNACGVSDDEELLRVYVSYYGDQKYSRPNSPVISYNNDERYVSVFKNNPSNKQFFIDDEHLDTYEGLLYPGFYLFSMYANGYQIKDEENNIITNHDNATIINSNNQENRNDNVSNVFNTNLRTYYTAYPPVLSNHKNYLGGQRNASDDAGKRTNMKYIPWPNINSGDSANIPGNTPMIGIAYYGDANNNLHFFNTYFPVLPVSNNSYNGFTQKISLNSTYSSKISNYIGDMIVSALGNIYVDKNQTENDPNATKMSDIVYLAPNYTTFTKDMVFRVYSTVKGRNNGNAQTTLKQALLINGMDYNQFINDILTNAFSEDSGNGIERNKVNMNNVDIEYNECVKTFPLQYRVNYINPDFNILNIYNSGNSIKLKMLDGSFKIIDGRNISSEAMYYYSPEIDSLHILDQNYSFRYIQKFEQTSNGELKAIYVEDDSVANMVENNNKNQLYKFLQYKDYRLMCKNKTTGNPSNLYSYTFHSWDNSDDSQSTSDFMKNEVLLNIGKLIRDPND